MNRSLFFYLGVFATLALSWMGIVLVNQISYGRMTPELDANDGVSIRFRSPESPSRGGRFIEIWAALPVTPSRSGARGMELMTNTVGAIGRVWHAST